MSKWDWSHEKIKEANKDKKPNFIMSDGMSGRPMAILFPFTIGDYFISTPEEWAWIKSEFERMKATQLDKETT